VKKYNYNIMHIFIIKQLCQFYYNTFVAKKICVLYNKFSPMYKDEFLIFL